MKPSIGWMHIKDYHDPKMSKAASKSGHNRHVEEDALKHFVPVELGASGHERVLRDFAESIPHLQQKLTKRGIPGVVLDLEPHLKGGGQFGGFSGQTAWASPSAASAGCSIGGIDYHLRDFDDVRAERGF